MKKKQTLVFLGLCAAGLATGHVVKRVTVRSSSTTAAATAAASQSSAPTPSGQGDSSSPSSSATKSIAAARSTLRSKDTLETLKAAEGPDLYARLALWMVDASEEDISAYWQHYRLQDKRRNEINDLIFINWTRINPQGATAAAKGTPDEHYAWWAWACHDPVTALSTAIATNPDRVSNVTWGIGEFHPDWLREHFDELPEGSRDNALAGMAKWDDGADPLEKLEFLKKHGQGFHPGVFKVLTMRDPWAAYDWLQKNGSQGMYYDPYSGTRDTMATFLDIASEQHPEVLKRIIDQAPSGDIRRQMEAALFKKLLETDPEAAVQQAGETKAPYVATQRYAAAAMHYLASDPDKAFELAQAMFEASPQAMNQGTLVEVGNSSSTWGDGNPEVQALMSALIMKDPARTLAMHLPKKEDSHAKQNNFGALASQWAESDIAGLAEWTKQQDDPLVRDHATSAIINKCSGDQDYESALEWAMSASKPENHLSQVIANWARTDPAAARAWLDSSGLPEDQTKHLKHYFQNNP